MDSRRRVGILSNSGAASAQAQHQYAQQQSAGAAPPDENDQAEVHSRRAREMAALKLWREWAADSLGPMSSEPTHDELQSKSKKVKQLERKCAELAARAQRRLQVSHAIRSTYGQSSGSPYAGSGSRRGTGSPRTSDMHSPSGFNREAMWATRELHKTAVYQAVKEQASSEAAEMASASSADAASPVPTVELKSRAMLQGLLSQQHNQQAWTAAGLMPDAAAAASSPKPGRARPQSASPAVNRHSSLQHHEPSPHAATGGQHSQVGLLSRSPSLSRGAPASRPQSARPAVPSSPGLRVAVPSPGQGQLTGTGYGTAHAARGSGSGSGGADASMMQLLQEEMEGLRMQLDESKHTIEAQTELETQLRDTIDMLRARLHAQNQRELENQRRLQQHQRLEPLFDRLAESFVFKSPEEVIDRLEFLEDDKLGTFDQLLRTQEEVTSLQTKLEEATKRVETVKQQLTTDQIQSTAKLQAQNDELRVEIEAMESLNSRLTERQDQLVTLQTAVLDLWSRCQADPAFIEATKFEKPGGGKGGDGASATGDPVAILSLVQEYLIAKSPQLSSRHYLDMQRVANRVWLHHFQHKENLRGKVVETFEQLSSIADILASKYKITQEQLNRSKENVKVLGEALKRLEVQKRSLQVQLGRRDQLVRDMSGVPRKERPESARQYSQIAADDSVAWTRPQRPHSASPAPQSPASRPPHPQSLTAHNSAVAQRQLVAQFSMASTSSMVGSPYTQSLRRSSSVAAASHRPSSAPVHRQRAASATEVPGQPLAQPQLHRSLSSNSGSAAEGSTSGRSASRQRPHSASPGGSQRYPGQSPLSAAHAGHSYAGVRVSDRPLGDHWSTFEEQAAGQGTPRQSSHAGGALFQAQAASNKAAAAASAGAGTPGATESKGAGSGSAWVPPSRSSIESSFLNRLERAAGVVAAS